MTDVVIVMRRHWDWWSVDMMTSTHDESRHRENDNHGELSHRFHALTPFPP